MDLIGLTTRSNDCLFWEIISPNGKEDLTVKIGYNEACHNFFSTVEKKGCDKELNTVFVTIGYGMEDVWSSEDDFICMTPLTSMDQEVKFSLAVMNDQFTQYIFYYQNTCKAHEVYNKIGELLPDLNDGINSYMNRRRKEKYGV